ncbi:MAG: hypothetical protein ACFB0Z_00805 [Candidatus Phaeomarinobacter sp.]
MRPQSDWDVEGPTSGFAAFMRNFSGNRRTTLERRAAFAAMTATPALALAAILIEGQALAIWQIVVLMALAVDLGGGVFVNATAAAKRWFHRIGARDWHHLAFVLLHIHPLLIAWLLPEFGWVWAAYLYAATVTSTVIVLACPLYLRRPMALTAAAFVLAVAPLLAGTPLLLAWIAPFYVLKLLVAHIVHEEPYAA